MTIKSLVHGDYTTEYGREPETGLYLLRQHVRGELVLEVRAETREDAISAGKILALHELVRRDDIRHLGVHEVCEGCRFVSEVGVIG